MPLIINQGKQDTSNDKKTYAPIVQRNALVQIVEIKLDENLDNTLVLNMQVLDGENKNRYVVDRITFDPTSKLSWKYRNVRRAVGVPYSETESANIDVEAILLNKAMRVDLGTKDGIDRLGNAKTYQTINYKPLAQVDVPEVKTEKPKLVEKENPLLKPQTTTAETNQDDFNW
jgi:hypothetical protein